MEKESMETEQTDLELLYQISRLTAEPPRQIEDLYAGIAGTLLEKWRIHRLSAVHIKAGRKETITGKWNNEYPEIETTVTADGLDVGSIRLNFENEIPGNTPKVLEIATQLLGQVISQKQRENKLRVAELQHAWEELETREKLLQAMMDNTPAVIYTKDLNGRYLNVNRMYETLFETTREQTEGKTPFDIFPHQWAEKFDAIDRQIADTGEPRVMEEIVPHKDGLHTYLSSKFLLHNYEGTAYAVCVISIDITSKKEAEEELKQYKEHLEEMVRQRTAELEQFIFVASHDLQEPLRKILAFGDRLVTRTLDGLDERGQFYLDRMMITADNMRYLLDDLLLYSRLIQAPSTFNPVDSGREVLKALENLEIAVMEKDAFIDVEPLPHVMGNEWQVRQLFQNIISNSVKYAKVNLPPKICIRGNAVDDKWAEFTVKDNGIGFDEKYLTKVFKPFQRLHSRGEYQGTGMGLTICKKIVEHHKGDIRITSTPDIGTSVIVRLPLYLPQQKQQSPGRTG